MNRVTIFLLVTYGIGWMFHLDTRKQAPRWRTPTWLRVLCLSPDSTLHQHGTIIQAGSAAGLVLALVAHLQIVPPLAIAALAVIVVIGVFVAGVLSKPGSKGM